MKTPAHIKEISINILKHLSREDLRKIARESNIPRGRNKVDTLRNLIENFDKIPLQFDVSLTLGTINFATSL